VFLDEEMPPRKDFHRELFHVRSELLPPLHNSLVGAGILGAGEADKAEREWRKRGISVVITVRGRKGRGRGWKK